MTESKLAVSGILEIVGWTDSSHLIDLRDKADEYNKTRGDGYFYWVINGQPNQAKYLLVREKQS